MKQTIGLILAALLIAGGVFYSLTKERSRTEPVSSGENQTAMWKTYRNEIRRYEFQYPPEAEIKVEGMFVKGDKPFERVEILGPTIPKRGPWPWIYINHLYSEFFTPPQGTDVYKWLVSRGLSGLGKDISEERLKQIDQVNGSVKIDGLPTVHLKTTEYSIPSGDEFYFVKGTQLYKIGFIQTGVQSQDDWKLYNEFLRSFRFY